MNADTIKQLEASEIYARRQRFTQAKNKILASIDAIKSQVDAVNLELDDLGKLASQNHGPYWLTHPAYTFLASDKSAKRIEYYTEDFDRQCTPCTESECDIEDCLYFHTAQQMAYKQVLLAEKLERTRQEELIKVAAREAQEYKGKYQRLCLWSLA